MMDILSIQNVIKHFSEVLALDNVSLNVEEGSVLGLLGPNGAGKTTLLRVINNLLTIDSGSVTILGEPASLKACRNIGYMPEERGLYDKMKVQDQIMYFGLLKGGDPKRLREIMNEYISIFQMEENINRKIKELSKGNQQKVQIISTIVHEPKLVILDEPFSGFDPINGILLRDLVNRLQDKGTTILLSSHNMPAVEEMCNSIALINKGKVLMHDNIEDIKENNKTGRVIITSRSELDTDLLIDSGAVCAAESRKDPSWRKGYSYYLTKNSGVSNNDLLQALSYQCEILHYEEELPSLNEIFIKYTKPAMAQNETSAESGMSYTESTQPINPLEK